MNKKIFLSFASILAAMAMMGGATFAFFSSTATSSNNTFASGTLNLHLDDVDQPAVDGTIETSISAEDFMPGQSVSGFISLHNPGTLPIAEVELTADTSETNDPGDDSDMRSVLNLSVTLDDTTPDNQCAGGSDITSVIDTQVGNGSAPLSLVEFDNGVDIYDALPGLAVSETRYVCLTVEFDENAGNEYQGDAVSTTFTFTGNQNASQ